MKRRRKKALSPLMAMLLAVAAMVLVVGRMATPAFSAPGPATHLSLVMEHGHVDPAAASIHHGRNADQDSAEGTAGGPSCDQDCLGASSSCLVVPPAMIRAGAPFPGWPEPICLQPGNDLMLAGTIPEVRFKPPKSIA
jgi:hypothetical protein